MTGADVGVFGGSGFYSFLEETETVEVETPYGSPSAPVTIGEIGGKRVALPRHGGRHEYPPHRIPYKANLWAMKELGVGRVLGPNAWFAAGPREAGRLRDLRPSWSTAPAIARTPSTTVRSRPTSRSPTRTAT